jgi:hypothetical protein
VKNITSNPSNDALRASFITFTVVQQVNKGNNKKERKIADCRDGSSRNDVFRSSLYVYTHV